MPAAHATVDAYLADQPAAARAVLAEVRAVLRAALPDAAEQISYAIPAYKVAGRGTLWFAGHAGHYAIYPVHEALVAAVDPAAVSRLHGKASLHFRYDEPVPATLITALAQRRADEVRAEVAAKKAARQKSTR